jgi:hypothetical protein
MDRVRTLPLREKRQTVPVVTVIIGALLVALGLWGRFGTEHGAESITSLIPAFLGLPLVLLGLLALKESFLKHAMHAAAMLGLIGLVAGAARLAVVAIRGGNLQGASAVSTELMTLVCAVYVALCVNSFIAARRRRRQREAVADRPA